MWSCFTRAGGESGIGPTSRATRRRGCDRGGAPRLPHRRPRRPDPGRARLRRGRSGVRGRGVLRRLRARLGRLRAGGRALRIYVGDALRRRGERGLAARRLRARDLVVVALRMPGLGGLGNAISHPATHLLLAREVSQNRQGLAFGIKQAAIPAATLIAGLAVPLVATTVGWRWAFAGGAALVLCVALLVPKGEKRNKTRRVKEARAGDAPLAPLVLLALGIHRARVGGGQPSWRFRSRVGGRRGHRSGCGRLAPCPG